MRLGPGPVFEFECLTSARRWQLYTVRALFLAGLLVAMLVTVASQREDGAATIQAQAELGKSYFYALVGTQLALLMLAAPAFTAGAICLDRARGALAHVLTTDLSDAEIVLGKLGSRLMPVVGLVACAFPLMSLGALLGGIDPQALGLAFLVALAVAVLSCALALALSVWAGKTQEVLMAVYAFWAIELLCYPIWQLLTLSGTGAPGPPRWLLKLNPYWLSFSPYMAPNESSWTDFVLFVVGAFGLAGGLTALVIVRLRPVTAALAGRSVGGRSRRARLGLLPRVLRALPGPSLDTNPVLWREWHRNRGSWLARAIWWGFFGALSWGGVYSVWEIYWHGVSTGGPDIGVFVVLLGVALGLLLVSVNASTSLSEERTRGSLDVLLATPLATRTILWGKWWGAYRIVPMLAFWPTVVLGAMAFGQLNRAPAGIARAPLGPLGQLSALFLMAMIVLVHGAALTSLGLALATWVSRQGRAVGICVAAYVMLAIGWMIVVFTVAPRGSREEVEAAASLSPVFAAVNLCEQVVFVRDSLAVTFGITSLWLMLVGGTAAALYLLTLGTFDRCLGRTSDWNDELRFESRLYPVEVPQFEPVRSQGTLG